MKVSTVIMDFLISSFEEGNLVEEAIIYRTKKPCTFCQKNPLQVVGDGMVQKNSMCVQYVEGFEVRLHDFWKED